LSHTFPVYVIGKGILKSFIFNAQLTRKRQLVTFGELSNLSKYIDTTGTGSLRVAAASRVALSSGCPGNMDVNLLHGKAFGSGTTN
jgi:hypothetical protein